MPHRTLADFLEELGRAGELAPVDADVDLCMEAAEITRRVFRQAGPALLFRSVKGHSMPLLTNLFGSESRVCRALGDETIDRAIERIDGLLHGSGEGWLERLRLGGRGGALAGMAANRVKSGACQQIVRLGNDIDLAELPCPLTAGEATTPAIASATILSAEPDSHARVSLRGEIQIVGRDRLLAVWSEPGPASSLLSEYALRQARMPVAVCLGGDPSVQLATAAPVPAAVDPLALAGLLREKPLDAVPCRSIDLFVPAESDIVIEGIIDTAMIQPRTAPQEQQGQEITVLAVTHRANRIFAATISGQRDTSLAVFGNEAAVRDRAMAHIFLPLVKMSIPELADFDLPLSGGARHLAVLAIRKTYAGQAHHVATAAWAMRPFVSARLLVVVDTDVNVRDAETVWAAIAHETHLAADVLLQTAPPNPLDPTSHNDEIGRRMAIDATRKLGAECRGSKPRSAVSNGEVEKLVSDRWTQYGLGPEQDS